MAFEPRIVKSSLALIATTPRGLDAIHAIEVALHKLPCNCEAHAHFSPRSGSAAEGLVANTDRTLLVLVDDNPDDDPVALTSVAMISEAYALYVGAKKWAALVADSALVAAMREQPPRFLILDAPSKEGFDFKPLHPTSWVPSWQEHWVDTHPFDPKNGLRNNANPMAELIRAKLLGERVPRTPFEPLRLLR